MTCWTDISKGTLDKILEHATRKALAGIEIYSFECAPSQAEILLEMARDHCPPAVKDIEHAIFAVTAS